VWRAPDSSIMGQDGLVTPRRRAGLEVRPVTPARWKDLETLFGPRGAYGGCWCMWFRTTNKEFESNQGAGNRRSMRGIVRRGEVPGLLAYRDGAPVGWVAVAPRAEYGRIERSPTLKPVDDRPVWSVVCFYIDRRHRGAGVGRALLDAAVDHARSKGARIVEGYPEIPRKDRMPGYLAYTGVVSVFEAAGFREVARRGARPIMRRNVRPSRAKR
jgi:GNAT superfamily N-acetyltransferase